MEDIARLSTSETNVPNLDYQSDSAELIFEKVKLVSNGTMKILGSGMF